jgi:predicted DNA-binding transcriptional regulator AlpA
MPEFIRFKGLAAHGVPFCRPTINAMIRERRFPSPVPYGRQVAWLKADIDAWVAQQLAGRGTV